MLREDMLSIQLGGLLDLLLKSWFGGVAGGEAVSSAALHH